jgi:nucleotide-binding universal stress UspA family protein
VNLRSIVCPVDFSEPSRQALRWAAAFAQRFQSRLTVLTAVDPLLAEAAKARLQLDLARGETEPELRRFVSGILPEGASWAPEMALDVRVGHPAEVILDAAGREHADLIVMGTQGLGGLSKMILGSTAERVLRRARTAVLAVPPLADDAVVVDASGARLEIRRLLAATDFSDTAAIAMEWAASLSDDLSVPLTLVHVVEPLTVPPQWRAFAAESDEPQMAKARTTLAQVSPKISRREGYETLVSVGRPADRIASLADECGAGLIVMGLMGHQGPLGRRPGSIAYRVLGMAKAAVVVVPPPAA